MRRSLIFMLTLIFVFAIFAGPAAPRADAVVVSSIIVGTVIAAMAAAGIGLTVSGMTSSQLTDWVGDKLGSWASSFGGSVEDHINGNLITTTASGIISIGTSAANSIAQFLGWLQTDESLSDNSQSTVIAGSTTVLGYDFAVSPFSIVLKNNNTFAVNTPGVLGCILGAPNNLEFFMISQNTPWLFTSYYNTFQTNGTSFGNGYYYKADGSNPASNGGGGPKTEYEQYWHPVSSSYFINNFSPSAIGSSGSLVIDTGVITIPTIDTNTQDKWFIDVGAAPGTTIQTVTDGVIADTIEGDLTVSGEVAEEEPEFVIDEPIAVSGLSEVFPFCIPFDIYALLSALSADPQTPVFTARFVVPGIIDEEFTIDLTPFNAVAQIVRTMELLAFIIGLALVTRERFLRS